VILDRVPETPYYRDAFYLDRLAQVVHIVLDQQVVVVINVHLESYDRTTRGRQLQQVIALYKRYSTRFPTLLVGDFNSDPVSANAHIHELLAMPNIGAAAFSIDNYVNTYNSGAADQRLDYIFYNRAFIAPIDGRIATEFGQLSDHFPVLFRFKLRPLAVQLPTDDAPRL
jgi:endonuclease/exonuclease/phosphatase family metal-dependent hydrolase